MDNQNVRIAPDQANNLKKIACNKKRKNWVDFPITKICQNLKHFTRSFYKA